MDKLSSQSWFAAGRGQSGDEYTEQIRETLTGAPVAVSGILAESTITFRDLVNLEPGDLITTDKRAADPAVLCVEGRRKMLAHIGQLRGARALKIQRAITPHDRL